MPSWSIHLKIGKELLNRMDLDMDKFLFGSTIPDTDYDWKLKRFKAHYYGNLKFPKCPYENMIDIDAFFNDYKEVLNDDLIKGYYAHLLADNFYNEYIYYNKWLQKDNKVIGIKTIKGDIIDVSEDYCLTAEYKHIDLELYGRRLFKDDVVILPEDASNINESIKLLKDNFITDDNVKDRLKYLHSEFIDSYLRESEEDKKKEYLLFTKDELDELLNKCTEYIYNKIRELEI